MKSHEVMRQVNDDTGTKQVASGMGVGVSTANKWAEGRPDGRSVVLNPPDRMMQLYEATRDRRPTEWLCQQQNGFFTENPPTKSAAADLPTAEGKVQAVLGELIGLVAGLLTRKCVSQADAVRLRQGWEKAKSVVESFVRACERGCYRRPPLKAWLLTLWPTLEWLGAAGGGWG